MNTRAFSRADTQLNEATRAVSFRDVLVNASALDSTTVIVPTASHRRDALITLARHVRGSAAPAVYMLSSFARDIVQADQAQTSAAMRLLTTADAALILRYAARATGQRLGSLDFSIERLLRWKAEGITPADLEERASDDFAPRFVRILDRFARIWSAYETVKGPKGADRVDILTHAARFVVAHDVRAPSKPLSMITKRVVIWYPHMLSQAEASLVRALGSVVDVAIVWAPTTDVAMVRNRTSDVIGWGWEQDVADVDDAFDDSRRLGQHDAASLQARVSVRAESTRMDEIRRILVTIKQAVAMDEVDVRDVCIITPGSNEYRRQLIERAGRAGIPISIEPQRALHTCGVALALRAACDVASDGWRRADVERLLRSGFVNGPQAQLSAVLGAASAQRLLGGNGSAEWTEQLKHRRDILRHIITQDVDNDDVRRSLHEIDMALQGLAWLRPIVGDADSTMNSTTFVLMLTQFLQQLGIARRAGEVEAAAQAANLPCAEREALVAIEALSERYAVLSQEIAMPMLTLAEHKREWWEMVRANLVRIPDVRLDGIPILTPDETRGRTWKLVLAPGFVEGEFPARESDPLELEVLPDLATRKQFAAFQDVLQAVDIDGRLVLTYPKEVDDTEALPSSFLSVFANESRRIAPNSNAHSNTAEHGLANALENGRTNAIEPENKGFILDRYELASLRGKGLADIGERQRAALPTRPASTLQFVQEITSAPLSASRLDTVAACPYQFYAGRILKLSAEQESLDTLSGLERGAMMHDIARRFYERVRGSAVRDVASVDDVLNARVHLDGVRRHEYMAMLLEIYDIVSRQYDTHHTYAETERRSILGTPERPGLLFRWLAHELREQDKTELRPALFEFELNAVVHGEAVRGRVDRIDVSPFETPTGAPGIAFAIIDYKTTKSSLPSIKRVTEGDALQMPLYVAAVQAEFEARGIHATPFAAIYRTFGRSMKSSDDPSDRVVLKQPSAEQMDELFGAVAKQVRSMRTSEYPVAPRPLACMHCNYIEVCRIASWGATQRFTETEQST